METEAEYDALISFADDLTNTYDCNTQPHAALFDLVTAYVDGWERRHYPDLKDTQLLAHYLGTWDISAYRLAKALAVSQGNLSAVLHGKRGISKALAKKL